MKAAITAPNEPSPGSTRTEDWSSHLLLTDARAPRAVLANAITALRLAREWEVVRRGRRARLMEIDPKYADCIVRRYQEYSGKSAVLDSDARTFEVIAAERKREAA